MPNQELKKKMFELGEKFAKKVVSSWDEKQLIAFAKEQYRRQMQSDGTLSLDTFDSASLAEEICDYFGELDIEIEFYRENDFSDEEIREVVGDEVFSEFLEEKTFGAGMAQVASSLK
jgi:hypothetical protein